MARDGRALGDGSVWLDATPVGREVLAGYPWLYPVLRKHGVDLAAQPLAVRPAAHTSLGGIKVDIHRATGAVGLFAAGEASAGVHGAGRLAGGSATEVVVSGTIAGRSAAAAARAEPGWQELEDQARASFDLDASSPMAVGAGPGQAVRRLRDLMSTAAGVWRSQQHLTSASGAVERQLAEAEERTCGRLRADDPWLRVRDMLLVGRIILGAALQRTESRGAHQRTDHPARDPVWDRHIEWRTTVEEATA